MQVESIQLDCIGFGPFFFFPKEILIFKLIIQYSVRPERFSFFEPWYEAFNISIIRQGKCYMI